MEIIYYIFGLFCYLIISLDSRKLSLSIKPNISASVFITFLVMIYIPALEVYKDYKSPYRDTYLVGVLLGGFFYSFGVFLCNFSGLNIFNKEKVFFEARLPFNYDPKKLRFVLITTFLFLLLILSVYFSTVPSIPILDLIRGNSSSIELTLAREESFKLLDPRWGEGGTYMFYLYLFSRTLFFPLLISLSLTSYLIDGSRFSKYLFWVVFFVGGIYAVSTLSRAPIAAIIMRLFIVYMLYRGKNFPLRNLLYAVILMLLFPVLVSGYANFGANDLFQALEVGILAVLIRLSYTPAQDLYYYFEIFPYHHDFLLGATLFKPFLKLFEFNYFYIENFVANYINPHGVESAHANAAYLSNLYADFGLIGIIIGSCVVGYCIRLYENFIFSKGKNIITVNLYAFSFYALWVLNFGSVTSVIFVNGLLPAVLIALFLARYLRVR
jgi:oligosaccharide repeat unit polymerase